MKKLVKFGEDFGLELGEVIIGDICFKDHVVFAALGGSVNVAARLQELTKSLNSGLSSPMKSARWLGFRRIL